MSNLATLLRPTTLENFVGQSHIIGPNKALYKLIQKKRFPISFFMENQVRAKPHWQKLLPKPLAQITTILMPRQLKSKIYERYLNDTTTV